MRWIFVLWNPIIFLAWLLQVINYLEFGKMCVTNEIFLMFVKTLKLKFSANLTPNTSLWVQPQHLEILFTSWCIKIDLSRLHTTVSRGFLFVRENRLNYIANLDDLRSSCRKINFCRLNWFDLPNHLDFMNTDEFIRPRHSVSWRFSQSSGSSHNRQKQTEYNK